MFYWEGMAISRCSTGRAWSASFFSLVSAIAARCAFVGPTDGVLWYYCTGITSLCKEFIGRRIHYQSGWIGKGWQA